MDTAPKVDFSLVVPVAGLFGASVGPEGQYDTKTRVVQRDQQHSGNH